MWSCSDALIILNIGLSPEYLSTVFLTLIMQLTATLPLVIHKSMHFYNDGQPDNFSWFYKPITENLYYTFILTVNNPGNIEKGK